MDTLIACIGSGNMGTALMKGAAGGSIAFTDVDKNKAEAAAEETGGVVFDTNAEAAEKGDFLFLAVKPQILQGVLEEIAPVIGNRVQNGNAPVLVSMAPGWSIAKIRTVLAGVPVHHNDSRISGDVQSEGNQRFPVLRIMPNTPALIGRGMIAACAAGVNDDKLIELKTILSKAGELDFVEERYMDAVTGLSGSGPAFVYLFIEALADGGVLAGLPRDKALRYAAQTAAGAAEMVQRTGKHPGELKDMVTSPGGTTIAGTAALERGAFRGTVISAVEAAWKRSIELG